MDNGFGSALKEWRAKRRISQLQLSLAANVSARHIAFLETGRARPSRSMVMHLGEALDVPSAERNRMLDSAGFRPAWSARALDAADMEPVRRAIARIIERHDPYPAFVIDRHWNLVTANRSGALVLAAFGVDIGGSLLKAMLEPGRAEALIENWPEAAAHVIARLRTESAHVGGDPVLDAGSGRPVARPGAGPPHPPPRHARHHPRPLQARRPGVLRVHNDCAVWHGGGHRAGGFADRDAVSGG